MLFVENWKQLGIITLSESGRSQRDKCCMFPFICVPWTYRYIKSRMYRWHENRSRITWGGGWALIGTWRRKKGRQWREYA